MSPYVRLPLLLSLLAGTACLGHRESDLEATSPVHLPEQWQAATATPLDEAWLDDFDDPQLADLVQEAWHNNPELAQVSALVAIAEARAAQAGAPLWPSLDAAVDVGRARSNRVTPALPGVPGSSESVDPVYTTDLYPRLVVQWELDVWGRLSATERAATEEVMAVRWDLRAAEQAMAVRVCRAWFAAVEAQLQLQLTDEGLDDRRKIREFTERRYRAGLLTSKDLALANQALASSRADHQRAVNTVAVSRREIERLLGRYPAGELALAADLPAILTPIPGGLPSDLLARRPDIQASLRRARSVDEQVSAARADLLPRITLTGSVGRRSDELGDLSSGDFSVWSLAAGLLAPIFDGGRRRAVVSQREAERQERLANHAIVVLRALFEVETALVQEEHLRREGDLVEETARHGAQVAEYERDLYLLGVGDVLLLLEAHERWLQSRSRALQVRRRLLENRLDLYLALGGDVLGADEPARDEESMP